MPECRTVRHSIGPVPNKAKAVWHFFGPVPDWNYWCRNADASISFLDADAQLWYWPDCLGSETLGLNYLPSCVIWPAECRPMTALVNEGYGLKLLVYLWELASWVESYNCLGSEGYGLKLPVYLWELASWVEGYNCLGSEGYGLEFYGSLAWLRKQVCLLKTSRLWKSPFWDSSNDIISTQQDNGLV